MCPPGHSTLLAGSLTQGVVTAAGLCIQALIGIGSCASAATLSDGPKIVLILLRVPPQGQEEVNFQPLISATIESTSSSPFCPVLPSPMVGSNKSGSPFFVRKTLSLGQGLWGKVDFAKSLK